MAKNMSVDDVVALLAEKLESEKVVAGLHQRIDTLSEKVEKQEHEIYWWKRQYFGALSERRILNELPVADQLWLGAQMLDTPEKPPEPSTTVKSYERKHRSKPVEFVANDSRLRFDDTVPVEVIEVPNPELDGLAPEEVEQISERVTYRLAQRSAYVVLKYVQPVVKLRETGAIVSTPAPPAVIDRSFADVSFLAGLAVDKFQHHLPLYRQHQRLEQAGITINRSTLTRLVHRTGELIEPIYHALTSSIMVSQVLTVDESPTPAGIADGKPGKVKTGYFWAMYGDRNEVAFLFSPSRSQKVLEAALQGFAGTLLSDGFSAYQSYVKKRNLVHAQCWTHTRRNFIEAEKFEPDKTAKILRWMQKLYQVEDDIAESTSDERFAARQHESKPIIDKLFEFFRAELDATALLPSNPFLQAIEYAVAREKELRVFLDEPAVPIDTNHVERCLRRPAVGRKNWMFHVTEVGARYAGMFYSLIESCKLVDVNPTVYFVDVLQRIDTHPAIDVHLLTPRLWKEHFAGQPLVSDLSRES